MQPDDTGNLDALVARGVRHFHDTAKDDPTDEEIAAIRRAALKGKDFRGLKYVVAGLLGVRQQKFLYGEDAMKRARALRRTTAKATNSDDERRATLDALRATLHAAVDAFCDYMKQRSAA